MTFPTIRIEGAILSADILDVIAQGDGIGQQPADFGFPATIKVKDEIARAWADALDYWRIFQRKLVNTNVLSTTETRKFWVIPLLNLLGYEPVPQQGSEEVNGRNYPVSHRERGGFPIHVVGWHEKLDLKRQLANSPRWSPHGMVQEYLNLTEHAYALVTNGSTLRLLRDNLRLGELWCVEFDLDRMMEEEIFADFAVMYRLFHVSRQPHSPETTSDCWLEKYHQDTLEGQSVIREGLSRAVEGSIIALSNGFLNHPTNEALRKQLNDKNLTSKQFYQWQRRLVYRLLFLMVAEERDVLYDPAYIKTNEGKRLRRIYDQYYSLGHLRRLADRRLADKQCTDTWTGLLDTFRIFEFETWGRALGLASLGGSLFCSEAIGLLNTSRLDNRTLQDCLRMLSVFTPQGQRRIYLINYKLLDVQEFGSVYEGLLDLRPVIVETDGKWSFAFAAGTDRKTTGSYYTRPELTRELVRSALEPVIAERLRPFRLPDQREGAITALLGIRLCDPAAGSGHMLIAAARHLAQALAQIQTGEDHPGKTPFREALREVIQHCIYGVDLNPDAVELCQIALWIESHNPGKALSFLEHRIKHGNSLVGVADLNVLKGGIPDDAFNPIMGDDSRVAKLLKRANDNFRRGGQHHLMFQSPNQNFPVGPTHLAEQYRALSALPQDSVADAERVRHCYEETRTGSWWAHWQACNIYTAAFFQTYTDEDGLDNPTSERLANFLRNVEVPNERLINHANSLQDEHQFFHWPLEFPDVLANGGFDVVMGNPPWERIKLQEQEFFSSRDRAIATAANKAAREQLIGALPQTNPSLHQTFTYALHAAEAQAKFIRTAGRYPLTATGDINTYSIFAELDRWLLNPRGRAGVVVPTGIATDDNNKAFFGDVVTNNALVSLFDFENREALFQGVHRSYKFCLLTVAGKTFPKSHTAQFAFFLTNIQQLQDERRVFGLTADEFARLNPNTRTCPVFRTRKDADLTARIYRRLPVLINESSGENPWSIRFATMFHMSNDSHLFRTQADLRADNYQLQGNRFIQAGEEYLPLYESKFIWQYNHRFGSYEGVNDRNSTHLPTPALHQYQDPHYTVLPWYWVRDEEVYLTVAAVPNEFKRAYKEHDWKKLRTVIEQWIYKHFANEKSFANDESLSREEVSLLENLCLGESWNEVLGFLKRRSPKWLIGFRDITNATNERTFLSTILPLGAVGNTVPIILPKKQGIYQTLFYANINTLATDLIARQKIGGLHLNFFYIKQIPFLSPDYYTTSDIQFILPRVLELTYTAWDLQFFFDDVWADASEELRAVIIMHWTANQQAADLEPTAVISLPFIWNEERRALLRAELDAYYARLYGLSEEDLCYILDPKDVHGRDFPSETFRVLKEKEIRRYGEYRTRRLVLEAFAQLPAGVGAHIPAEYISPTRELAIPDILKESSKGSSVQPPALVTPSELTIQVRDVGVHTGIYSVTDAVNIVNNIIRESTSDLTFSAETVSIWFRELWKAHYEGFSNEVNHATKDLLISFHGLIELVAIAAMRNAGGSLQEILKARRQLIMQTGKLYPFTVREELLRLKIYGKKIIQERPDNPGKNSTLLTLDGTGQFNLDLIKQFLDAVDFQVSEGITKALFPRRGKGLIAIDPTLNFGQPSIIDKGVPISSIKQCYKEGTNSILALKTKHKLEEAEILVAIDYLL